MADNSLWSYIPDSVKTLLGYPVASKPVSAPDRDSGMSLEDLVRGGKRKPKPISNSRAVVEGLKGGALLGGGDEIQGAGAAVGNFLGRHPSFGDPLAYLLSGGNSNVHFDPGTGDFSKDLERERKGAQQTRDDAWETNPKAYAAGYVPGFVTSLALPGGRVAGIERPLARTAGMAGVGAGYGALSGGLEANPGERLGGAERGAAVGAVLAPAIGRTADKLIVEPLMRRAAATAADDVAVQSPSHYVDRLQNEGLEFANSPEGSQYFTHNAPAIKAELDNRASGVMPEGAIDRRVADSDAYHGEDRRVPGMPAAPGVDGLPVNPTAPPTTHFDVQRAAEQRAKLDQIGAPSRVEGVPPMPPEAGTAGGFDTTYNQTNGLSPEINIRDTDGLKALMAERGIDPHAVGQPPVDTPAMAARAPSGPEFVASVNTRRMGMSPEEAEMVAHIAGSEGITPTYRSRPDTEAAGDALGAGPTSIPSVGDVSAVVSAGDKIVDKTVDDVFDAVGTHGTDSPQTEAALSDFVSSFGAHSENVGETGRAMNILRKEEYNARGKKIGDPEAEAIVRKNLADPETRDAAVAAIKMARGDKAKLGLVANKLRAKSAGDFVSNVYYSAWLSDPASQSRNIFGNTEKLVTDLVINGLTAIPGVLLNKLSGSANRVFGREVAAQAYGAMKGALSGLSNLKAAYLRGAPLDQVGREGSVGFGGKIANTLEFGPRAMAAGDEFFRSAAFMSDMYRRATRDAIIAAGDEGGVAFKSLFDDIDARVAKPTHDAVKASVAYAKEARFQNDLQGIGGAIPKMVERGLAASKTDDALTKVGKGIVRIGLFPFNRTPANIMREAARTSPLGVLSSRNWQAWRAGGPEAQTAAMRVAFGTGVAGLIWNGVSGKDSWITGTGPADYKKLAAMKANGWTPNSFHIGGKYIPYDGLGPLSVMLSGVATSSERFHAGELDGKGFSDNIGSAALGIADAAIHNGWMSSLADVFDALGKSSDGERTKAVTDTISSIALSPLTPGLARAVNQSFFDPYARETKGSNATGVSGSIERAGNRIQAVYPGVSDKIPVKKDVLGEPVLNRRQGGGIGAFISPSVPVYEKTDAATQELGRLERGLGKKVLIPPAPTSIDIEGLGRTRLNGEDYQTYQALMGAYIKNTTAALIEDPSWKTLDDNTKRALVSQAVTESRVFAKEEFLNGLQGQENKPAATPAPSAKPPEAAPLATFIGVPTSIGRTKKGNALVNGKANSDHLRGDAIDFVPPEGMSMSELEAQAKEFFPGMFVLNEGTHVHVRIPGLNGPLFGKKGSK